MHRHLLSGLLALLFSFTPIHAATLGIPGQGTTLSGMGVISGWKCRVNGALTVRFDGRAPIPLLYGAQRPDVLRAGACTHDRVGFLTIWNWGELGDGQHTAVVYDNGVEFARSTFEVVTTGEAFRRGLEGTCAIEDFPNSGDTGHFAWNQSTQHLELTSISGTDSPVVRVPHGSKLYWAVDYFQGEAAIYRANLDGYGGGNGDPGSGARDCHRPYPALPLLDGGLHYLPGAP